MEPLLISVADAARVLGLSTSTIGSFARRAIAGAAGCSKVMVSPLPLRSPCDPTAA